MRGWTKRKIYEDRVCECGVKFNPCHQAEVCCSPNCKAKAQYRQSKAYVEKRKARIAAGESATWVTADGQDRQTRARWKAYMEKNPFYLAGLYTKTDLAGAVADMRKRGAL
jgi:hypothetical protein